MTDSTRLILIDPNGDTLIILRNPKFEIPRWKEEPKALGSELPKTTDTDAANITVPDETPVEDDESTENNPPTIKFLASSRQLRIVSTYFDNMFKRPYTETIPNAEDGLYHIDAQEWNPYFMKIVLNVAHIQTRRVPKEVSLAVVAQIYVIMDYYQMAHCTADFAKQWMVKLQHVEKPTSYCAETILWMFMSLILRDWHLFGAMARMATKRASQPIQYLGLPFPPRLQGT